MTVSFSKDLCSVQPKRPEGYYSKWDYSQRRDWDREVRAKLKELGVGPKYPILAGKKGSEAESRMIKLAVDLTAKHGIEFEAYTFFTMGF